MTYVINNLNHFNNYQIIFKSHISQLRCQMIWWKFFKTITHTLEIQEINSRLIDFSDYFPQSSCLIRSYNKNRVFHFFLTNSHSKYHCQKAWNSRTMWLRKMRKNSKRTTRQFKILYSAAFINFIINSINVVQEKILKIKPKMRSTMWRK